MGDDDHRLNCCRFTNNQDPAAHPVVLGPKIPSSALLEFRMQVVDHPRFHQLQHSISQGPLDTRAMCILRPISSIHCSLDLTNRLEIRMQIV